MPLALPDVLKPLLYADLFDYPLTSEEIHRFLEVPASLEAVQTLLDQAVTSQHLITTDGLYCLTHRSHLMAKRQERWHMAQKLWPQALHYGKWLASLPFVVMVAVTGSLAVNNPRSPHDDIDYLIVTQPGRLWLCRALMILLVRYGHLRGVHLCPNYILTEHKIYFNDHNLYAARELIQMVPIYGLTIYQGMRQANPWVTDFLPQGVPLPPPHLNDCLSPLQQRGKHWGEFLLQGRFGYLVEQFLQKLQITKHTRRAAQHGATDKVTFTPDECKGHYHNHGNKTLQAYQQQLQHITHFEVES